MNDAVEFITQEIAEVKKETYSDVTTAVNILLLVQLKEINTNLRNIDVGLEELVRRH